MSPYAEATAASAAEHPEGFGAIETATWDALGDDGELFIGGIMPHALNHVGVRSDVDLQALLGGGP